MSYTINNLWNKIPLAEAFWHFLDHTWPEHELNLFYDQHRGRSYEREISFAEIVQLLIPAITLHNGKAHPVLLEQIDDLPASIQAIYGKIRRMPRPLSHALIPADATRLRQLLPAALAAPAVNAKGLARFRHLVFDGHMMKKASKRLKKVRRKPGRALGGKFLAVLDLQSDLVVGLTSGEHSHINKQALLPDLLEQVRASLPGPRLWIGDRAFGNLANFKRCTAEGDHCLLRKTAQSVFTPDPTQPVITGTDAQGRAFRDEIGTLSSAREGKQAARQITILRPDAAPIVVITSLLDPVEYPATELLELYRKRWSIEQKYQKVSKLFSMGPYVSSHPNGILFQSALCLVLANNLQILQTLMAGEQERSVETISTHNLFRHLKEELMVCQKLMTTDELVESLRMRVEPEGDWLSYPGYFIVLTGRGVARWPKVC